MKKGLILFLFFFLANLKISCYNKYDNLLITTTEATEKKMESKAVKFADYGYERGWKDDNFCDATIEAIFETATKYGDHKGFLTRLSYRLEQDQKFTESKKLQAFYKAQLGIEVDSPSNSLNNKK